MFTISLTAIFLLKINHNCLNIRECVGLGTASLFIKEMKDKENQQPNYFKLFIFRHKRKLGKTTIIHF